MIFYSLKVSLTHLCSMMFAQNFISTLSPHRTLIFSNIKYCYSKNYQNKTKYCVAILDLFEPFLSHLSCKLNFLVICHHVLSWF